jgi:hypothetical protein
MNIFFTTDGIDKSLNKIYKWVPIAHLTFVACLLYAIYFIPNLQNSEKINLLVILIAGYSCVIIMFCVQALARIESKLKELDHSITHNPNSINRTSDSPH